MQQTPHPARSEGLLPDQSDDRAPEVAEEVSLDLQSDQARQVGKVPPGAAGAAMAEALNTPDTADTPAPPLEQAIERALPPSN
ncbi:MAG TPA: hypothetical protein VGC21_01830 [Telluria sp.]|jgi:hypothetical protein